MSDTIEFGIVVALVAATVLVAVLTSKLSSRLRVPAPALFLAASAAAAFFLPPLGPGSRHVGEEIVSIALVFILFDGGMNIGWRRFRTAAGSIAWIGVAGTAVTAAAIAVAARYLFGFDWHLALLLGAALSPTDPAVVFTVLGGKEIGGRAGTILEGESGANDPVGIAVLTSLIAATGGTADGSGLHVLGSGLLEFALQMAVGGAVGIVGGFGLTRLTQHLRLDNHGLQSVLVVAAAAAIYGVGSALHGSGFLAVFIAGILFGDVSAPYKRESEQFISGLASLAEIVAFIVLGLNVELGQQARVQGLLVGAVFALILMIIIRPVFVGILTLPIRLSRGERAFVLLAGLKGAVPILLGFLILDTNEPRTHTLFVVIFVVVLISVVVQGSLVPTFARVFGVPMAETPAMPWSIPLRFTEEPHGLQRHVVTEDSPANGHTIAELDLGEDSWISMIRRSGRHLPVRNTTRLQAGDVILVQSDSVEEAGAERIE